jgi:hypothetical protein
LPEDESEAQLLSRPAGKRLKTEFRNWQPNQGTFAVAGVVMIAVVP